MLKSQELGLLHQRFGSVDLLEEVVAVPMSLEHVQDAILGVLVVVPAGCRVFEVFAHVVQDVGGHREPEVPPLVHFN